MGASGGIREPQRQFLGDLLTVADEEEGSGLTLLDLLGIISLPLSHAADS